MPAPAGNTLSPMCVQKNVVRVSAYGSQQRIKRYDCLCVFRRNHGNGEVVGGGRTILKSPTSPGQAKCWLAAPVGSCTHFLMASGLHLTSTTIARHDAKINVSNLLTILHSSNLK